MGRYLSAYDGVVEGPSEGDMRTRDFYSVVLERGYGFRTNVSDEMVFETMRELFLGGFDVFVGEVAFDEEGNELPGIRSIFVKG